MAEFPFSKILNPKSGWYRGDFHVHSDCSDGEYPVETVTQLAEAEGLDFYALTDHNTIEGFNSLEGDGEILVIPGLEVSYTQGHFNVFGMRGLEEWMGGVFERVPSVEIAGDDLDISELLEKIAAAGLVVSINHPLLRPWAWEFCGIDLRPVTCLEIWNDLYWPGNKIANPQAVAMWTDWLNAGHRITGIGGSDYHYPPKPEMELPGERLGMPTTYVFAETLSVEGILDGIRNGRAYVTKGPEVDFVARLGGVDYQIGDDLGEQWGEITFSVSVTNHPSGIIVRLIRCGEIIGEAPCDDATDLVFVDQVGPNLPFWYSLSVSDRHDDDLVITNPIYVGPRKKPIGNLYSDFAPQID
jgi:hypothetical protein